MYIYIYIFIYIIFMYIHICIWTCTFRWARRGSLKVICALDGGSARYAFLNPIFFSTLYWWTQLCFPLAFLFRLWLVWVFVFVLFLISNLCYYSHLILCFQVYQFSIRNPASTPLCILSRQWQACVHVCVCMWCVCMCMCVCLCVLCEIKIV